MSHLTSETPREPQTPFAYDGGQGAPMAPSDSSNPANPIRIYVACLAAYNNGHLHGRWITVTDEPAIWQAVQDMLAASPELNAEEWAIHDYEGFEGVEIGEYVGFAHVVELADFIGEHGQLGAEMLNYYGGNIEDAQSRFSEYAGAYDSLADYAQELTEQTGIDIPESLAPYIDYKAMAHDYEQSGDFLTFSIGGSVHIFWAH